MVVIVVIDNVAVSCEQKIEGAERASF